MRDRAVLLLLFALTTTTSVCCGAHTSVEPELVPDLTPGAEEQAARAAHVMVWCPAGTAHHPTRSGSGAVHFGPYVLTAFHVVSCATPPHPDQDPVPRTYVAPQIVQVQFADGRAFEAGVASIAPDDDLAWLVLQGEPDLGFEPLRVAPPRAGWVCMVAGYPKRERYCARASLTEWADMELHFAAPAIPGNSGSAVYDPAGRLVGVVTRCDSTPCANVKSGYASAVAGARWRSP